MVQQRRLYLIVSNFVTSEVPVTVVKSVAVIGWTDFLRFPVFFSQQSRHGASNRLAGNRKREGRLIPALWVLQVRWYENSNFALARTPSCVITFLGLVAPPPPNEDELQYYYGGRMYPPPPFKKTPQTPTLAYKRARLVSPFEQRAPTHSSRICSRHTTTPPPFSLLVPTIPPPIPHQSPIQTPPKAESLILPSLLPFLPANRISCAPPS